MRFRPEQHLRRQDDIRIVRAEGRRFDARAFTFWWRPRPVPEGASPLPLPRVCVVASTAAVGHAILRNRAKRRLRELFRQHQALLPAHCDFTVVARAAVNQRPFPELEKFFVDACAQITRAALAATAPKNA